MPVPPCNPAFFQQPKFLTYMALLAGRGFNCVWDGGGGYDIVRLWADLAARGVTIAINDPLHPAGLLPDTLDLTAITNPEGSILVVNAAKEPWITPFRDIRKFEAHAIEEPNRLDTVVISGVGSSALGAAALAWNVSKAYKVPVVAIVPGYGAADMAAQGLSGWFAFGLHNFLRQHAQDLLAFLSPGTAALGHDLHRSLAGAASVSASGVRYQHGSPEADILHHFLKHGLPRTAKVKRLVGHSKGALAIAAALNGASTRRDWRSFSRSTASCLVHWPISLARRPSSVSAAATASPACSTPATAEATNVSNV